MIFHKVVIHQRVLRPAAGRHCVLSEVVRSNAEEICVPEDVADGEQGSGGSFDHRSERRHGAQSCGVGAGMESPRTSAISSGSVTIGTRTRSS